MSKDIVLATAEMGFPWQTQDPFLFCVHHDDRYPAGDGELGLSPADRQGRQSGMDFSRRDGFSMYHGDPIPGFPRHPHRGFETVSIMGAGFIDHSDSLGATARFGKGDVQWMTAGKGIVHCEMFPLLEDRAQNPLELFQIWINLPAKDKMVDPYFTMLWAETIPVVEYRDEQGRLAKITVVAGTFSDSGAPPAPPPNSWAAREEADVAIWTIDLEANATVNLPPAREGTGRTLYFFEGETLTIGEQVIKPQTVAALQADVEAPLKNGDAPGRVLVLQGRPIGEPVAHHGPFVMNTQAEIQQAFADYRRTEFGGWPWNDDGPVHERERGRFARHADGRVEER